MGLRIDGYDNLMNKKNNGERWMENEMKMLNEEEG